MSWSKNKKVKVVAGALLGVLVAITVISLKIIYKPHIDLHDRPVKFTGTATELIANVRSNVTAWQDEAVQLTGEVTSIEEAGFTLDSVVYCQVGGALPLEQIRLNTTILIKARVIGYDDLLEEVKLDQTVLIPEPK